MTAVASADIHGIAEALRRTGKDSQATTQRVLIESANFLLAEMEARVLVDSGDLRRSLAVRVEGDKVTVGPDTPYASYVEFGTQPHEIRPKKADGVLVFQAGGRTVYAKVVKHPGTKAQPFVRPAFDAWVDALGENVARENVEVFTKEARKHA
jgi:HK97 gp10 family phage protein